jgi:hypothetical protein
MERHSHLTNSITLANELNALATTAASARNADRFHGIARILSRPKANKT